jgi:uncharacterized membrane protein
MDLWQSLGDLHPKLVHFPLVLLLAGLLFDLFGLLSRSDRANWAARALTVTGTVMLLFSFICGIYAEIWAGRALIPHRQIEQHELAANVASWGFVILAAWRLLLDPSRRFLLGLYTFIGLVWYVLLVVTAHLGGQLILDYGAAVTGARTAAVPTLHDLNTLATRQTDENLRYSEMMHHIFGYVTLALAGSLLAAALFPSRAPKLKWVGPALLLAGGIFLFLFADLDLYRLTDLRQWRDREVQLHKTIAVILAVLGAAGLRASRGRGDVKVAAKLIAVMALIGGGMLFTHVHTVAPYANVAAGVYVAHVVMGLVALSVGAASLLADAFPRRRGVFNLLFALCIGVEAILLLTYNEGLPSYIGYGRYNRWPKTAGGTVAPYGRVRAELNFDNATQAIDVRLLDRFNDAPVSIARDSLDLLIARGYQEIAVELHSSNGDTSRFVGSAPFLRDVPAFSARLALPVGSSGRMKMGYFDPWVTPVIAAVPPNEVAKFACPMHEGIRRIEPGKCPLCGMALAPIDTSPRAGLHDASYDMALAAPRAESDRSVVLNLTPLRDGAVLRDLALVHKHLLHLIIVSEDLSFFDHVHPMRQDDGTFTLKYAFPREGLYLLFADITPDGARSQVFRIPLKIGSDVVSRPAQPAVSPALARAQAADPDMTVELLPTPRELVARTEAQLLFRLARSGQPLIDVQPYLGAMGHCVIISEDGQAYLHSHPEQLLTPQPDARGGPDIAFHTRFPRAGRYKVWGQFRRDEKIIVADFVIDVADPPLPAWAMRFLFDD